MNMASLLSHPFELELKTRISGAMINAALAMKDLPSLIKSVNVEFLNGIIRIHIQTGLLLMKNIKVDAKILGIELSRKKSTVHCELIGAAGTIIRLLSLLKIKAAQISLEGNRLDIDITSILLKNLPSDTAGLLDKTQVHILSLEPGFINLGIKTKPDHQKIPV